jgi:acyl-CoA dehydrogenase
MDIISYTEYQHAQFEKYPIARAWRDIRVNRILAGTNEVMKVVVAGNLGL